jgi:alpha-beta hydrolase superfamily lysophospholipase
MNRCALLILALLALLLQSCAGLRGAYGNSVLFDRDQTYSYEALRTLGYTASGAADAAEVLTTIGEIRAGDSESWYDAWIELADRTVAIAAQIGHDPLGHGRMLLKAANYYRTAEFLLHGDDPRKLPAYEQGVRAFYAGLDRLGVAYQRITVGYDPAPLDALFVPGDPATNGTTLICLVNGYDSIKEEAFLVVGHDAIARGYSFLSYDGPGQGATIRHHGVPLTPEWAPVNRAVLDRVLAEHPEIDTVVLIGFSMGSILATKAAADDSRIDYLVHFDVFYDFAQAAGEGMAPSFRDRIFVDGPVDSRTARMLSMGMRFSSHVDWAARHGAWIMGTGEDYAQALNNYRHYQISDDAPLVTCPVLLLAGEVDHFVPLEMAYRTEAAFSGSDDVTLRIYSAGEGGGEHCQVGAQTLWTADLFDWLAQRAR